MTARFKFSLRTLLVLTLISGVLLGAAVRIVAISQTHAAQMKTILNIVEGEYISRRNKPSDDAPGLSDNSSRDGRGNFYFCWQLDSVSKSPDATDEALKMRLRVGTDSIFTASPIVIRFTGRRYDHEVIQKLKTTFDDLGWQYDIRKVDRVPGLGEELAAR